MKTLRDLRSSLKPAEQELWDRTVAQMEARVPADGPRPRLYLEEWNTPPRAAAAPWPALLRLIGADPFVPPPASDCADVSWEELLEFDPQVVAYAIPGQGRGFNAESFLRIEGWNATEAAKHKRLLALDDADAFGGPLAKLKAAEELQGWLGKWFWGE
jgi:ABC-type Fe3+-hydroxamate transport system substrate-binding protein